MSKSFQERRKEKQKASFIGRSEHLNIFKSNLQSKDPINIFNMYGQGGVGKSYLVSQYRSIAEENNCLTTYSDESVKSVLQWMESTSDHFKKKNVELTDFDKRYKVYLQEIKKLETDPEKPKGTLGGIVKAATRGLIKEGKKLIPGGEVLGGFIDEENLSTALGEWAEFARKKIANKDEVELVLEPEKVLTPLFWKGVSKYAVDKKFICLFIDTYEVVDTVLEKWLLDVLDGKYGEVPENILLIIAGREELDPNTWSDLKDMIQKIQLEPFTEKEAREFLISKNINDEKIQSEIIGLSGRLPVLMALLTDAASQGAGAIEDPAQTAVERFLKWVEDNNQRTIALAAALPRRLNQDIIESLLTDKSQAKSNFEWLTAQAYVLQKDDHWVYHDVVREQMLRFVRIRSNKEWTSFQQCLEKYYTELQKELELPQTEEFFNKKWMEYEHEKEYHQLCFKTDKYTPVIMQQFVRFIYEQGVYKAGTFGDTLMLAGKDLDNDLSRAWGQAITGAVKEFIDEGTYVRLQQLVKDIQVNDWIKNDTHRAFLYLVEGITAGSDDEAIKAYEVAIGINPDYAEAYYNKGLSYSRKGEFHKAVNAYEEAIAIKPEYLSAHLSAGLAYSSLQEFDKSIEAFQQCIAIDADDSDAWYNMGSIYFQKKEFDKAIDAFEQGLAINPDDHEAYNNLGISWYNKREDDKALDCYLKALELKPDYYLAFYNMGLVLWSKREFDNAIQSYQNAIANKPDYYLAYYKMGQTYLDMGQPDDAIASSQKAIALKPDYADAFFNMALAYADKKDFDKAIEAYRTVTGLKPDDHQAIGNLGMCYYYKDDYDKAIESLEKAVTVNPQYHVAFNNLGLCYNKKDDYANAIKSYQQAVTIQADYVPSWFNMGIAYVGIGDHDNAIATFIKNVELEPADFEAYYQLGRAYGEKKLFDKAIESFDMAIGIKEDYQPAWASLGWAYVKSEVYDKAIAACQKALELDPADYESTMNLGLALFNSEKHQEGIDVFHQAANLQPTDSFAYLSLGNAYMELGDYKNAIEAFEKTIALDPEDTDSLYYLAIMYSSADNDARSSEIYLKLIDMLPDFAMPYMGLGFNYLKAGKLDEAEPLLQKTCELQHFDLGLMNLGHVYLCRGNEEKALENYEEGLSISEEEDEYWKVMKDDFGALEQYGITSDYYNTIMEKIKRPVKTPAAAN